MSVQEWQCEVCGEWEEVPEGCEVAGPPVCWDCADQEQDRQAEREALGAWNRAYDELRGAERERRRLAAVIADGVADGCTPEWMRTQVAKYTDARARWAAAQAAHHEAELMYAMSKARRAA